MTTTHNERVFGPKTMKDGNRIQATVSFDDCCGNGHNDFAITGVITSSARRFEAGGCIHEEIAEYFPELAPLIKWHRCSTDGPMHYIANTIYHVQQGRLASARRAAIWPDATYDELTLPGLDQRLLKRLPALMAQFRLAVESLGFKYE